MKSCSKCKKEYGIDGFYTDTRRSNGLQSQCKECFKAQHAEYRRTDNFKKWVTEYRNSDKEKERNRNFTRLYSKTQKYKDKRKIYIQTERFKEYERKYNREYKKRPKVRAKSILLWEKYKARKVSSSDGTVTYEATQQLLKDFRNSCNFCKVSFTEVKKHLDHIEPLSKGGKHTISNVQWLCQRCNIRKSNKLLTVINFA